MLLRILNIIIYLFVIKNCLAEQLSNGRQQSTNFFTSFFGINAAKGIQVELKALNIVERLLMTEHFLRTATRLWEFQRKEKAEEDAKKYGTDDNAPLGNLAENRPKGFVNTLRGYLSKFWVKRFANWNSPPNECFYAGDSWANQMDGIVYAESIPYSLRASFLCEGCLNRFPIKEAMSTFKQFEAMKSCRCEKFIENEGAIHEGVLLMKEKCSIDPLKIENVIRKVVEYFKRNLIKMLKEYRPRIKDKSERNAVDFDVLLAFLFRICAANLGGNYSEGSRIMKLKNWLEKEFERLTGINFNEFCQNGNLGEECEWKEMIGAIRRRIKGEEMGEDGNEGDEIEWGNGLEELTEENEIEAKMESKSVENRKSSNSEEENDEFDFWKKMEKVHKKINKNAEILEFAKRKQKIREFNALKMRVGNLINSKGTIRTFHRRASNKEGEKGNN